MSIRWDHRPTGADARRLPVIVWHVPRDVTRARPAYVRLAGPWWSVWLHKVKGGPRASAPCRENEPCPFCPQPSYRYAYAPAYLWRGPGGNDQRSWVPVVCGFTDKFMDAYEGQNVTGWLVSMWRETIEMYRPIAWNVEERSVKELPGPAFDCEAPLNLWWGYFEKMREIDRRNREGAWQDDLSSLVNEHDATSSTSSAPPATVQAPPPPIAPPTMSPAATGAKIRELLAKARNGTTPAVEPATAEDLGAILPFQPPQEGPEPVSEPKTASKRKPGRRKGGAS